MKQAGAVVAEVELGVEAIEVGKRRRPTWATLGRATPTSGCPRERLLVAGAASLANDELVSVILGKGWPDAVNAERGKRLLQACGSVAGLARNSARELRFFGLDESSAAVLLAATELARRLAAEALPEREPLGRPCELARYLSLRYEAAEQEVMGVVLLDQRNRLIEVREIFRGTLCRAAVEPRQILRAAILASAAAVVLFHFHPSGDPSPSGEDYSFTRRMVDTLEALGLRLIDHLVIAGPERWLSMRERRPW